MDDAMPQANMKFYMSDGILRGIKSATKNAEIMSLAVQPCCYEVFQSITVWLVTQLQIWMLKQYLSQGMSESVSDRDSERTNSNNCPASTDLLQLIHSLGLDLQSGKITLINI